MHKASAEIALGVFSAEPPSFHVPPPDPICGIVVDEQGMAVERAELSLGAYENGKVEVVWQARSDARGRFLADRAVGYVSGPIPALETLYLTAYRDGSQPVTARLNVRTTSSPDEPVRLELRKPTGVTIQVKGPDGAPVAGAKVRTRGLPYFPEALSDRLAAKTGTDGLARLSAFSAGENLSLLIDTPGFGTQTFWLRPEDRGEMTATLRAPGRIVGRVVADDPARARGVVVRGYTIAGPTEGQARMVGTFEAVSDAEGRFEIPAQAAGWVTIDALRPARDLFTSSPSYRNRQPRPKLEAGGQVEVEVKPHKGVPVRGLLREHGTGRSIAAATVTVESAPAGGYDSVRTDADGRFEGFVGPGQITVRLRYAGPFVVGPSVAGIAPTLAEGSPGLDLDPLEMVQGNEVRGIVRDEAGQPVSGAVVEAWTIAGQPVTPASNTDRQGRFVLSGMTPGVALLFSARAGEAASGLPGPLMPGEVKDVELVVRRENTGSIGGRVLDEHGKPLAGVNVLVQSRWTSPGAASIATTAPLVNRAFLRTDAAGRYQTPRTLPAYASHRAMVFATGKASGETDWFAPTSPSLFDLELAPTPPPGWSAIVNHAAAGLSAHSRGDYSASEASFEKALAEADKVKADDPLAYARWLAGLAEARLDLEKYDDAEALGRRVLALREKVLDAEHPAIADAKLLIARAHDGRGEAARALDLYREATLAIEQSTGRDSPRFADALAMIGRGEARLGQFDQAESVLTRSIEILERDYDRDHLDVAFATLQYAYVLDKLDRPVEAERAYRRAFSVYEAFKGLDHPDTLNAVDGLAGFRRKSGHNEEAEALETRAREARRARQAAD